MILIYDDNPGIKVGEELTITWVDGRETLYEVISVRLVDCHTEVEAREVEV